MSVSENVTIPIHRTSAGDVSPQIAPRPKKKYKWKIPRSMIIGFYSTLLIGVGYGCWRFLNPASTVENAEAIAELDGFESAPAFQFVPKPGDAHGSGAADRGLPVALENDSPPHKDSHHEAPVATDRSSSSQVSLTGTIEDTDAAPKQESPLRISGTPYDSSAIR